METLRVTHEASSVRGRCVPTHRCALGSCSTLVPRNVHFSHAGGGWRGRRPVRRKRQPHRRHRGQLEGRPRPTTLRVHTRRLRRSSPTPPRIGGGGVHRLVEHRAGGVHVRRGGVPGDRDGLVQAGVDQVARRHDEEALEAAPMWAARQVGHMHTDDRKPQVESCAHLARELFSARSDERVHVEHEQHAGWRRLRRLRLLRQQRVCDAVAVRVNGDGPHAADRSARLGLAAAGLPASLARAEVVDRGERVWMPVAELLSPKVARRWRLHLCRELRSEGHVARDEAPLAGGLRVLG
mmetsp:Transcript_12746/g.42840  ORF Transcript_12746/g.42840 Transcript_12746/m.42840 type:complete len:295 (+) Transcript_12746:73-957(+)